MASSAVGGADAAATANTKAAAEGLAHENSILKRAVQVMQQRQAEQGQAAQTQAGPHHLEHAHPVIHHISDPSVRQLV